MEMSDISDRIKKIHEERGDPERAHDLEDSLYRDFIQHVAEHGPEDLREKAKAILKTEELDFPRWCA